MVNSRLCETVLLIRTPVNADNGHLFLAQTDSYRRSTSVISIVCCNKPFVLEG